MTAVYDWKAMLKDICKEKGYKIKYEAKADIETDTLTFIAKICPYNQIKEIEVKMVIE